MNAPHFGRQGKNLEINYVVNLTLDFSICGQGKACWGGE